MYTNYTFNINLVHIYVILELHNQHLVIRTLYFELPYSQNDKLLYKASIPWSLIY